MKGSPPIPIKLSGSVFTENKPRDSIFLFRVPEHCLGKSSLLLSKVIYFIKPKLGMERRQNGPRNDKLRRPWNVVSSREAH